VFMCVGVRAIGIYIIHNIFLLSQIQSPHSNAAGGGGRGEGGV
jgi:hypothetical protein